MNLDTLSIATINLLNLNLPGRRLYTDPDGWTPEVYARKVDWTARQLGVVAADVVGFQELWHADCLGDVLRAAGVADDYDVLVPPGADGRAIVCAAIVRKGLLAGPPTWIDRFPDGFRLESSGDDPQTPAISVNIDAFSRPVLHFAIRPRDDEPELHVYVCHFKSKGPTKVFREPWFVADRDTYTKHATALGAALSTIRRTAEAAALRFVLTERMKDNDTPVVVIGDVNDGQHSNTANILTGQPRYLVGDSVGGGDLALYAAQTLQEYRDTRDVYYTHVHQDVRESLDHVLVSQELYDNSRRRRWLFQRLTVNNDHLDFDDHAVSGTSDHGVVRAVFRHRPARG